ncbi:trypsin-like peptidase domain-containing protein [Peterkaempfera sp. SMS 1(5)a]|uniref:trypsin-like peptidase domain-containing protein n=1 Tax=Peterkaempfera podocarpi TaxID=3232308 RepID=UPI00366A9CAE
MADGNRRTVTSRSEDGSWRVRILDEREAVLGAGVLLGRGTVLTCAHVVPPDGHVLVDRVDAAGRPVRAQVIEGCWIPEETDRFDDPGGDVALLALDTPQPQECGATLHRVVPTSGRAVSMCGYPRRFDGGVWFRAEIAGRAGRDGRVQMFPRTPQEVVRPGFSGAAVTDNETGRVIGIVVNRYRDSDGLCLSYMIPTETVLRHLPQVRTWAHGPSAVDAALVRSGDQETGDSSFAERLARWLDGGGPAVRISTVRPGDEDRTRALHRAIMLADRELSGRGSVRRPAAGSAAVPAVGSLDLAVDAARRSAHSIAAQLAERLGLTAAAGGPADPGAALTDALDRIRGAQVPLTVVVDGVDDAPDPPALLDLLATLAERSCRLLLILHGTGSAELNRAVLEIAARPRLARLSALLDDITGRAQQQLADRCAWIDTDVGRATRALTRAHTLRSHLDRLGATRPGSTPLPPPSPPELDAMEGTAEQALAGVEEAIGRLDRHIARCEVLRGRLRPYQAMLAERGAAEQPAVEALYRRARDLLWHPPCDPVQAEEAVDRYTEAVRRWIGGTPGEEAP